MTYHATRLNNNPITIIKTIMTATTIYTCLIIIGVQQRRTDGIIIQHVWRTPYNNNMVAAHSLTFCAWRFRHNIGAYINRTTTLRHASFVTRPPRTGRSDGRTQAGRDERTARESVAAEGIARERESGAAVRSVVVAKVGG